MVKWADFRELSPLLLFLLMAPSVVVNTGKGWHAGLIALLAVLLSTQERDRNQISQERDRNQISRILYGIALFIVAINARDNLDMWYMYIKPIPVYIACAGAVAVVFEEIDSKDKDAQMVRALVFRIASALSIAIGLLYAREMVSLMEEDNTLTPHQTTVRTNCTNSTQHGFLFDSTAFNAQCPTRLWKHMRVNLLLGVQIYVTYTLTTSIQHKINAQQDSHKYTMGTLIVVECFMWTLASALQFDVIEDCYNITITTATCITIAAICHVIIFMHNKHGGTQLDGSQPGTVSVYFRKTNSIKLKL